MMLRTSRQMGLSSCATDGLGSVMVMPSRMMAGMKPKCTTGCMHKYIMFGAALLQVNFSKQIMLGLVVTRIARH